MKICYYRFPTVYFSTNFSNLSFSFLLYCIYYTILTKYKYIYILNNIDNNFLYNFSILYIASPEKLAPEGSMRYGESFPPGEIINIDKCKILWDSLYLKFYLKDYK